MTIVERIPPQVSGMDVRRAKRGLADVARYVIEPKGITDSWWPEIRSTVRADLDLTFDGWQDDAARLMLSTREDGMLAHTVGGFGMSLPRQVGKTFLLIGVLFGLCLRRAPLLVVWTSHHERTTNESFMVMRGFAQRPRIAPYIQKVYTGRGDEEIQFVNGSRMAFGARERGFGRGIPGVDVLVMDEAQILSERAMQNMLASMAVSKIGLHIYCGTPPKPGDNCEVFTRMRDEALSGESTDTVWIECSADADADLDDKAQWRKANASFPHRTPAESVKRLRRKLDADGFRREGLGIWPSNQATVFDLAAWTACEDMKVPAPGRATLVVAASQYRVSAAIGVAGVVPDGRTVVLVTCGNGVAWVGRKVAELVAAHDVAEVAVVPGEARGVTADLGRYGVEFKKLAGDEVAASCTAFQEAVDHKAVTHVGQPELDTAVASARTRRRGEAETWDDADPAVVAVAAAFHRWGILNAAPYNLLDSVR